jgi:hypothetical protein
MPPGSVVWPCSERLSAATGMPADTIVGNLRAFRPRFSLEMPAVLESLSLPQPVGDRLSQAPVRSSHLGESFPARADTAAQRP